MRISPTISLASSGVTDSLVLVRWRSDLTCTGSSSRVMSVVGGVLLSSIVPTLDNELNMSSGLLMLSCSPRMMSSFSSPSFASCIALSCFEPSRTMIACTGFLAEYVSSYTFTVYIFGIFLKLFAFIGSVTPVTWYSATPCCSCGKFSASELCSSGFIK